MQTLQDGSLPCPSPAVRPFLFFAQKCLCFPLFLLQMSKLSRPPARLPVWRCYCLFFACLAFSLLYALCRPSVLPIYAPAVRSCFPFVRPSVFPSFFAYSRCFCRFSQNLGARSGRSLLPFQKKLYQKVQNFLINILHISKKSVPLLSESSLITLRI